MRRAFTLIELAAVIVVLALIAVLAVPRYFDLTGKARSSTEDAVVAAVRGALAQFQMNGVVSGTSHFPTTLDSVSANTPAAGSTPLFTTLLDTPVTTGWSKGTTVQTYVSDAGNTFLYDPTTGMFDTAANIAAYTAAVAAGTTTASTYTNSATWTAGPGLLSNAFIGSGYTIQNGEVMMSDSSPAFNEAARRVALSGAQAIQAGTYTLTLDTELTNYYNQLNYWMVVGIKNGTQVSLTGDTMRWGTTSAGMTTLFADYAPPAKSDGNWYTYSGQFTVSATDAAAYDQIVVVMAGSRASNQSLGWRNVSLSKP